MDSSRLFSSREFMNSLRISTLRYNSNVNLSKFSHYIRDRSKRIIAKITGRHQKHRAGWQHALKRRDVSNLTVPVFISSNIQSLVSKYSELCYFVHFNEYRKSLGVIVLQETWLHRDIDDCVINIAGFSTFRVDRNISFRNHGRGVLTYVNQIWCKSVEKCLLLLMFIYLVSPFSVNQSFLVALYHWLLRTFIFHPNAPPYLLMHLRMSLPLLLFLFLKPDCV